MCSKFSTSSPHLTQRSPTRNAERARSSCHTPPRAAFKAGKLQVEHFTQLLRPNSRQFHSLEELSKVKHGSGRQELEFTHAPSIRASRFASGTSLDDFPDRVAGPGTRVISNHTSKPDRARPPELTPGF
eukprot:1690419-Amphidinium_carterae.1